LVRLGSDYGGWTIPNDLLGPQSVCYSGGVGRDVSFDVELIGRFGCKVYGFDPTPDSAEFVAESDLPSQYEFLPYAFCRTDGQQRFHLFNPRDGSYSMNLQRRGGDYFVGRCRSVSSVMKELGHARLDLLKLDIEGAEYEVLDSILDDGVEVGVLCVEFHRTPWIRKMTKAVRKLRGNGYIPVHIRYFDTTFVRSDLMYS
jgi:FkbM family methyltransferase